MKIDGKKIDRQLIREPDKDTLFQDENGVWRGTCVFTCAWSKVFQLAPQRFQTKHPDFTNLLCDKVSIAKDKGGIARITAEFAGGNTTSGNFGSDANNANAPIIEVDNFVIQAPIETHPRFVADLAGTPDDPKNGAQFDDDGMFTGFAAVDSEGNASDVMGISTWDMHVQVVRQITILAAKPTNTEVGIIDDPPVSDNAFEYIKTRASYQRQGGVYVFTEEWTSGPRDADINPLIYDY